jgi:hypothetical protein
MATLTISNSYLEGKGAVNNNEIIYGSGCEKLTVTNSILTGNLDTAWTKAFNTGRDTTVINTQVMVPLVEFDTQFGKTFKVFNSLIAGAQIPGDLTGIKFFHNYDENGNAIPDHQ